MMEEYFLNKLSAREIENMKGIFNEYNISMFNRNGKMRAVPELMGELSRIINTKGGQLRGRNSR